MKSRAVELEARRRALIARSAAQRVIVAAEVEQIARPLRRIDARITMARRFFARPWLLLGVAAALLTLLGPRKLLRIGTRGAMLLGRAQRVLRLVQR